MEKSKKNFKHFLVLAGGGTGGHLLAGFALAEAARKRWGLSFSEILFIGTQGRMEEKWVPEAGYPVKLLTLGPLNRVSWKRKLVSLAFLPLSFLQAFWILWKYPPQWLLGIGGFSSGPVLLAGWLLNGFLTVKGAQKIKIGILEQNTIPGMTNRWLRPFIQIVFSAFPMASKSFQNLPVWVVGNPIRSCFQPLPSASQHTTFTVLLLGGSQGSVGLNRFFLQALNELQQKNPALQYKIQWIHQTGPLDEGFVRKTYAEKNWNVRIEPFIQNMAEAYEKASLVICRAGASTLAELAAVGRAAILIPLPTAADNHQALNAQTFVKAGAAILIDQLKDTPSLLAKHLLDFIQNPSQLEELEKRIRSFHHAEAASLLWDTWEKQAGSSYENSKLA